MALAFPLQLNQFFDGLRIHVSEFDPTDATITTATRGGEQLTAEVGNVLWRGTAELTDYYHADADAIRAKMAILRRAGASFFVRPSHRVGPIADPAGAILGAATPTLHSVLANNRDIRITGLPADYAISAGDYLSFAYGSNPVRYAFHQAVNGATASGAGTTPVIEVTPHIRPGFSIGAAVVLVRPFFKGVLSARPGYGSIRPLFTGGMGFEFVQTLG